MHKLANIVSVASFCLISFCLVSCFTYTLHNFRKKAKLSAYLAKLSATLIGHRVQDNVQNSRKSARIGTAIGEGLYTILGKPAIHLPR